MHRFAWVLVVSSVAAQQPWPELAPSIGEAFRTETSVVFDVPIGAGDRIEFPRLNNVLRHVSLVEGDRRRPLRFRQNPTRWTIELPKRRSGTRVLLGVVGTPHLPTTPHVIAQREDGRVVLPARHAVVHSEKLCFEAMPHKNTLGYWVNPKDWAEWHVEVKTRGRYDVFILQGCGRNQGGSEVAMSIAGKEVRFTVEATGHFQCFKQRRIGTVELAAGRHRLQVRPRRKAKAAVMDLRRVELVPARTYERKAKRPNVVVFLTDDQGTLDARCFGSRDLVTPNLDGLAHSGVRFTQAYAHLVCCPARAMLLTGRYPQRGGVNNWTQGNMRGKPGRNMQLGEVTLAETLRDAGYATGLVGKWHLGAAATHGPTKQGFDSFFGLRGGFIDNYNHHFLHGRGFHDLYRGTEEVFAEGSYFPHLVVKEATKFIDTHRKEPFFLFVALNTPHYPEQSSGEFGMYYARHAMQRGSYGQMVSTTDACIGRVLNRLERYGLREDTILVFLSDNGHSTERFAIRPSDHSSGLPKGHRYGALGGGGNTGKWRGHKNTFFEGGIRVPMIVSYPKALPKNEQRAQLVTAMDVMPTVLNLCGVKPPAAKLDGHDLAAILQDRKADSEYEAVHWQWGRRWAVRRGSWKLIHDRGKPFLANLDEEMPERENHAAAQPALVTELTELHERWAREVAPR